MAIFEDCSVVVDLKNVPYKEKKKLMTAITDNGGNISYIVNQKCSFVVATSLETLSSSKQRNTQKHQTPIVSQEYVWRCLEKGLLLPIEEHVLKQQAAPHPAGLFRDLPQVHYSGMNRGKTATQVKDGNKFRSYKENDSAIPEFSSHFQVAKYSIFNKDQPKIWSVLELQSAKGQAGQQYRIVRSNMPEAEKTVIKDKEMHSSSSEDAIEVYLTLSKELQAKGFKQAQTLPSWAEALTSHGLQQLLLEEKLNCSTHSQEVGVFVELTWTEAIGSLNNILVVPVTSLSLNDVSRVEGLLLQARKTERDDEVKALLEQVNSLLPLRMAEPESKNKLVSQKLDLCQLIRDILNMTEATLGNPSPSSLGKYRALRCSIEQVPSQSPEFQHVSQLLHDRPVQIQQILRVSRGAELHMFREELGNVKNLLHSTAPSSFVGILSRGLLLPRVGVEQHGIQRTDVGNLGGGIYFSDSINTSLKYSKPTETDGSRLLLVCEVALGQCKDLHHRDFTLTCAPEGYDSVHGVRQTKNITSDFEDDEYVVYSTDQVRLKYVIQYILDEDQVKDFQPVVNNTLGIIRFGTISDALTSDDAGDLSLIKNPLEDITAGLLNSSGQTLPLQAVHVRCKLMDLLCQVIIFQTYTNQSDNPIEAKYVFPLEETATVCGFEAFINGKHVIGKVKEKEQARKEYKQAIEKGHGAYLMDQDAPDVFTISVGNLPPGATVLIKVTFLMELVVRGGTIVFSLPGSVAPWQQSAALNQRTQTTVEKVCVNELQPEGEFSLSMSIEMPYEIINLDCSHQIKIKRTDCKAVVSTLPDQTLNAEGFRLAFSLSQLHMPRMWVEKHPEKDTEACMLVFYPHFESSDFSSSGLSDVIILLDTSESMRGESMLNARRIALKVLNSLNRSTVRVNIITFGTDYKEAFLSPNLLMETFGQAKNFIMSSAAVGGSTELWRPLRSLNLLPPSYGVRNVLLLSDGHVQNQPQTLQMVRDSARHTRLFSCGLSPTANRHMLRALAQAGGGAYEFFDTKTKHTWAEKVSSLVRCMEAPGCSSVSVKWQQFSPTAPRPVQAPSQLCALFNDCHTLVYGFVPHCTQATLFGDLSGQELKTMVSTTELQKTKGTFLHKLTARAIIRDYEDGSLAPNEAEHEGKKAELKSYIIELSKEFSILSQFTSFVAIEERDQDQPDTGFTDVPKIVAEEDVDILPYMGWKEQDIPVNDMAADYESYDEYEQYGASHIDFSEDDEFDYEASSTLVDTDTHSPEKNDGYFPLNLSVLSDEIHSFSSQHKPMGYGGQLLGRICAATFPPSPPAPPALPARLARSRSALLDQSSYTPADIPPPRISGFFCPSSSADEPLLEEMAYGAASHISPLSVSQGMAKSDHAEQLSAPLFGRARMKARTPKRAALALSICAPPPPPPPPAYRGPPSPPAFAASTDLHLRSLADFSSLFDVPCSSLAYSEPQQDVIGTDSDMVMGFEMDMALFDASHSSSVSGSKECLPQANLVESDRSPGAGASLFSGASFAAPVPKTAEIMNYSQPRPSSFGASKECSDVFVPSMSALMPSASPPAPTPDMLSAAEESAPRDDTELCCYRSMIRIPPSLTVPMTASSRALSRARVHVKRRESSLQERGIRLGTYGQREEINWGELFDLQHQDGYWECTGRLSRFLGLDVDYFANVFLKEKGICSLGAKAHADILRLVATMLVLQLIRVQMAVGELFQSLLRLNDRLEHKPAHWDAVKKAVDWACWADRHYPCVCSRLELGWDWESCTRQLLRLDSPPVFSPLMPFLQRNTGLEVM